MLGNYVVLDKLGQGGMGLVLKTEHRRMKRLVALKVLSPKVMLKVELLPGKVQVVQGDTPLGTRPLPAIAPFKAQQARAYQEAWAKHLGVPVEYTNTLGMKFILIPPGEFTMDSTPAEIEEALKVAGDDKHWPECIKSEAPQHKVILTQPVYLGIHEVTQAQYEKVMGRNPSHFAATGPGKDAVVGLDTSTYPVEMVSWNDAAEFCAKLSEKEKLKSFYFRAGETVTMLDGTGYRLPTEAEWEFACRAGTTTKHWIGDRDEDLRLAGWFNANSGNRIHAVGELKANPFGVYDIRGNGPGLAGWLSGGDDERSDGARRGHEPGPAWRRRARPVGVPRRPRAWGPGPALRVPRGRSPVGFLG